MEANYFNYLLKVMEFTIFKKIKLKIIRYRTTVIKWKVILILFNLIMDRIQSSRIRTSTLFTRLQQAFKLKFAPLFAPLINLLNQI